MTTSASTGPIRNASRQPTLTAKALRKMQRDERAEDRPGPVGAVDPDVDPAPVLRRHHLVDRRVDRRVLAADAHPGDEPGGVEEHQPAGVVAGDERRQPGAEQVQQQGDDQQPLAPELVRHPARTPAHRSARRPGRPTRSARPRSRSCPSVSGWVSTPVTELAIGDLQAVEDPRRAKPGDHPSVERRPSEAVEPSRDRRANRCGQAGCVTHHAPSNCVQSPRSYSISNEIARLVITRIG